MKILLLIFFTFTFALLRSQAALTLFPNGPLEGYKAYLRGVCAATSTDCDLTPITSCYDNTSAAGVLNMMYQACVAVINSGPQSSHRALQIFFDQESNKYVAPIADALHCEERLSYARLFYQKTSTPEQGFDGIVANVIHYASVRPEDTFCILKNMASLAEQGNFEAFGLLDGNFMSQASDLKKKENGDWRVNAKNSRQRLLKGVCESLGLDCPTDSLNCMSEEASKKYLQFLYEWFESVATTPRETGAKSGIDFLLGRGKELINQIPKEEIERDKNSAEIKLINEEFRTDIWSPEWFEVIIGFLNEFPDLCWHYKTSEYNMFERNDLEGVGTIIGIAWHNVAEWRDGRLAKTMPNTMTDL